MSATRTRGELKFTVPVVEALGVIKGGEVATLGHSFTYDAQNRVAFMSRVAEGFPLNVGHVVVVEGFPDKDRLRNYHASMSLELGSKFPEQVHAYAPDEARLRLEVRRTR